MNSDSKPIRVPVRIGGPLAASAQEHTAWSDYGGDADSAQYSARDQIDRGNVARLEIAWRFSTGDHQRYDFNPLMARGGARWPSWSFDRSPSTQPWTRKNGFAGLHARPPEGCRTPESSPFFTLVKTAASAIWSWNWSPTSL